MLLADTVEEHIEEQTHQRERNARLAGSARLNHRQRRVTRQNFVHILLDDFNLVAIQFKFRGCAVVVGVLFHVRNEKFEFCKNDCFLLVREYLERARTNCSLHQYFVVDVEGSQNSSVVVFFSSGVLVVHVRCRVWHL